MITLKNKRLIALITAFILLFSFCVFSVFSEEAPKEYFKQEFAKVNQQLLEVEDMSLSQSAEVIESENAFMGKAVLLNGEKGDEVIGFNLSPAKASQLVVWFKYCAPSFASSAVYIEIDGEKELYELPITGEGKYKWFRAGAVAFKKSVGREIKVRVYQYEKGISFDSIYITDDGSFIPSANYDDFLFDYKLISHPMNGLNKVDIKPIEGHPRLLFNKDDIPQIKKNIEHPENKAAYNEWQKKLDLDLTGTLLPNASSSSSNKDVNVIGAIEANAFSYAIYGNEEHGRKALSMVKNMLSTYIYGENAMYHESMSNIWCGAVVYDWCYDLLTAEDKQFIVYYCQQQLAELGGQEYPYDFKTAKVIAGTYTITNPCKDPLALSIAIYDEYPDLFEYLAAAMVQIYKPMNDYIYQGGASPQGSGYGISRWLGVVFPQYLFEKCCNYTLFDEKVLDTVYGWIYDKCADGFRFNIADTPVSNLSSNAYREKLPHATDWLICMNLVKNETQKAHYKYFAQLENPDFSTWTYWQETFTPITVFCLNRTDITAKAFTNLPLTKYFPKPIGRMIAKTSWDTGIDSNAVSVFMNIKTEQALNHMHPDAGTFQIFYKGLVAPDLGNYQTINSINYLSHNGNTLSHNGLLIFDPDETTFSMYTNRAATNVVNTGGQRVLASSIGYDQKTMDSYFKNYEKTWKTGEVIGAEFGPDKIKPEYSYISGDITAAYTDKVSEVRRSMLLMPTENAEVPAVFFVMDKINSAKASFKKTYLLQAYEEPSVEGNVVTLARKSNNYTGAAVNQTLYPEVNIEAVGGPGKAWYINGTNYPPLNTDPNTTDFGWGRVEISPKEEKNLDYFMNVIYVCDTKNNTELQKAELIETDELMGAQILDKASLFAKASERPSSVMSFELKGSGEISVAVAGISSGEWKIKRDGNEIDTQISTEEGGIIYFKTNPGKITIERISSKADKVFSENTVSEVKEPDIEYQLNSQIRHSKTPLKIENGVCLIPIETLFESIEGTAIYSEDGKTVTATKGNTTITATAGESVLKTIVGGVSGESALTYPLTLSNGSLMLPARQAVEILKGTVNWWSYPKTLRVDIDDDMFHFNGIVPVVASTQCDTANIESTVAHDGSSSTVWTASGDGAWITFELEREAELQSIVVDSNPSITDRKYLFDIYTSTNGSSWKMIYSGESVGGGSKLYLNLKSPEKAKYVKYVGHQNTRGTAWNNLAEIIFMTEKMDIDAIMEGK